jgi:single-stranded-DNA-specific exonuclease
MCGLPRALCAVLIQRGLTDLSSINQFLVPKLSNLSLPFELPDMDEAVTRIWYAIEKQERITIFGDYDVDGITSTSLLTRILIELGAEARAFIPSRLNEGYGLNGPSFERCVAEQSPQLIITVDCGTNSADAVELARTMNIDVIVTDHHEPDGAPVKACAVVNPKLTNVPALRNLAGVGVCFKLCHALLMIGRHRKSSAAHRIDLRNYLDIVAMGTVADVVPLLDENRIFVHRGLQRLTETQWPGLQALKEMSGIKKTQTLSTYHVGFLLAPRINAAGRVGGAGDALELFLTNDSMRGIELAESLDFANRERQEIEKKITAEAIEWIDSFFDPERHYGIVVAGKDWHPGVVGIVASRLSSKYNRPVVVLGFGENGRGRGSGRSIEGFNIYECLQKCAQHLVKFGGHEQAAGLTIDYDNVEAFRKDFNDAARAILSGSDMRPSIDIDCWLDLDEIDWNLMEGLRKMEPFGQDNREPIFAIHNVKLAGTPRVVGEHHLKFAIKTAHGTLDAIAFGFAQKPLPERFDIAFVIQENDFMGRRSIQLNVKDFCESEK